MDPCTEGPAVLEALTKGCSQSPELVHVAEEQLKHWETTRGFYNILSTVFSNYDIDVNVRWLAALYCKNGVDRYWRKSAPNAMLEDEKEGIKKRLLSSFNEPVPQVATQIGVLIGKIARCDCPMNWADLFPILLQAVRSKDSLTNERALLYFNHVTKNLASKRLPADKKLFFSITEEIFCYIVQMWNEHLDIFFSLAIQHDDGMTVAVERCILTTNILKKLAVYGFKEPGEKQEAFLFLQSLFPAVRKVLECRQSLWGHHAILEKCEKLILVMTKILIESLQFHPKSYVPLIPVTLEFIVKHGFTPVGSGVKFERFTVNCFNLMKEILFSEVYKPGKNLEDVADSYRVEAYNMKTTFFSIETLYELCKRLIHQYLPLKTEELITWETDPEDFFQEEGGDSYKFSLRPCTEVLFLTLFKEFRTHLISLMLQMIQSVQGTCDPEDMSFILKKDSVYNAVGLATFDLCDDIDFDRWFLDYLLVELQNKQFNFRIIRRRVIWLIGQWIGVKMSPSLRPNLYQCIIPLLSTDEDLVVRLETANTLKCAVDDFEFDSKSFLPFLETHFMLLFELLKEVKECDTKLQVLNVMSYIIERVDQDIQPYASCLIQYLPLLWQESTEHNMLRCAILTTLIHLVQGFSALCTTMYDFILPVIKLSTDVSNAEHVYLLEDGLELWHVLLQNSPTVTPDLLSLYENMPRLLDVSTEYLQICLKIIEDYIFIGPQEFMHQHSTLLASSLITLMSEIRTEGQILVLKVIQLIFKIFTREGCQLFHQLLPKILKQAIDKDEHPSVSAYAFSLFALIILNNQQFMWDFLQQLSLEYHIDSGQLLGNIIESWCEKIDQITQQEIKKLSALAMASLLTANINIIQDKFPFIISVLVEVLHDISTDGDDGERCDLLVITEEEETPPSTRDTEHDKRFRQFCRRDDPVHTVSLKEYAISQLTLCQQLQGHVKFEHLMEQVDPDVLSQLHIFWQ